MRHDFGPRVSGKKRRSHIRQGGLICDGHCLTYTEIESRANRVAHIFTAHCLEQGERVALYLSNSVELVISIFAALKAGGVFVVVNHSSIDQKLAC